MPPVRTATYHLADVLLPGGIREFVESRRATGRSWRRITQDIADETQRRVDITHETLRSWFPDRADGDQGAAA